MLPYKKKKKRKNALVFLVINACCLFPFGKTRICMLVALLLTGGIGDVGLVINIMATFDGKLFLIFSLMEVNPTTSWKLW